jgi:plastocyanin
MPRILTLLSICLLVFAGAAFAGCGGSTQPSETSADTAAPEGSAPEGEQASVQGATVEVVMKDTAFDPDPVTAAVGDAIEWVNEDDFDHNVVATSGAEFESENFGKGGTFVWTAEKPGEIAYECTLHPGMTGTITVEE